VGKVGGFLFLPVGRMKGERRGIFISPGGKDEGVGKGGAFLFLLGEG